MQALQALQALPSSTSSFATPSPPSAPRMEEKTLLPTNLKEDEETIPGKKVDEKVDAVEEEMKEVMEVMKEKGEDLDTNIPRAEDDNATTTNSNPVNLPSSSPTNIVMVQNSIAKKNVQDLTSSNKLNLKINVNETALAPPPAAPPPAAAFPHSLLMTLTEDQKQQLYLQGKLHKICMQLSLLSEYQYEPPTLFASASHANLSLSPEGLPEPTRLYPLFTHNGHVVAANWDDLRQWYVLYIFFF